MVKTETAEGHGSLWNLSLQQTLNTAQLVAWLTWELTLRRICPVPVIQCNVSNFEQDIASSCNHKSQEIKQTYEPDLDIIQILALTDK